MFRFFRFRKGLVKRILLIFAILSAILPKIVKEIKYVQIITLTLHNNSCKGSKYDGYNFGKTTFWYYWQFAFA